MEGGDSQCSIGIVNHPLLTLGLGAGFAYSSGVLTALYVLFSAGRPSLSNLKQHLSRYLTNYKAEWLTHRPTILLLIVLNLVVAFLYLPLALQLVLASLEFPTQKTGTFWANPLRLFIPWLPWLNPSSSTIQTTLNDTSEGLGAMSPGWGLLIAALLGFYVVWKKKLTYYIPLLVLLTLCVLYHPKLIPTLKVFPWFAHVRSSGRSTVVLPCILTLLILSLKQANWKTLTARVALGLWLLLLGTEFYTAYFLIPHHKLSPPPKGFSDYVQTIKETPGEAVLDWPFCVTGGDRAFEWLCLERDEIITAYTLQRFHNKKVLGYYFGRTPKEFVAPFLDAGWDFLLTSNHTRDREGPCLLPEEERFFIQFLKLNDFAGINLYADLVPKSCPDYFRGLLGQPQAKTYFSEMGWVEFYQKPATWKQEVDATLGKKMAFHPYLSNIALDIATTLQRRVRVSNLGEIRYTENGPERVVTSGEVDVVLFIDSPKTISIEIGVRSRLSDQTITLSCNGQKLRGPIPLNERKTLKSKCNLLKGSNNLKLTFAKDGEWPDVFALYQKHYGWWGFANIFKLQRFYKRYRHEAALLNRFYVAESPSSQQN